MQAGSSRYPTADVVLETLVFFLCAFQLGHSFGQRVVQIENAQTDLHTSENLFFVVS